MLILIAYASTSLLYPMNKPFFTFVPLLIRLAKKCSQGFKEGLGGDYDFSLSVLNISFYFIVFLWFYKGFKNILKGKFPISRIRLCNLGILWHCS